MSNSAPLYELTHRAKICSRGYGAGQGWRVWGLVGRADFRAQTSMHTAEHMSEQGVLYTDDPPGQRVQSNTTTTEKK